jgi:hypothetical protein
MVTRLFPQGGDKFVILGYARGVSTFSRLSSAVR